MRANGTQIATATISALALAGVVAAGSGIDPRLACSPDLFEDDDDSSLAATIDLATCQFHTHCEDANDWMSIDFTAGEIYTIDTCNFSGLTKMTLYDPSMTPIKQTEDGGACGPFIGFTATTTGTHFIQVETSDGAFGDDREYVICIDPGCLTPDAYEHDDKATLAGLIDDSECQLRNHCDDGTDWVKFFAIDGETVSMRACNLGSASDTLIYVRDDTQQIIAQDDNSGYCDPLSSYLELAITKTSEYFIEIIQVSGAVGYDLDYDLCFARSAGATLLRNDAVSSLSPVTPSLGTLIPLDPSAPPPVGDLHVTPFVSGDREPDPNAMALGLLVIYEVVGRDLKLVPDGDDIRFYF